MERAAGGLIDQSKQRGRVTALPVELDDAHVMALPLGEGSAALIVRFVDRYRILVSDRIALGERAAVALHTQQEHLGRGCFATHCDRARAWLMHGAPAAYVDDTVVA